MNTLKADPWKIIEESFLPGQNRASESVFSLGNGKMGQRANFEESFSGSTLQGSYIAGVYYPDKTRVGWWKNGYPEYFAKVINAPSWIGLRFYFNNEELDLAVWKVISFRRELNMYEGVLNRSFVVESPSGMRVKADITRFISMSRDELGLIRYSVKPENFSGSVKVVSYLDADVENEDSNYDEKFWEPVSEYVSNKEANVIAKTLKTGFVVCNAMKNKVSVNESVIEEPSHTVSYSKYVAQEYTLSVAEGDTLCVEKYAAVLSSLNHKPESMAKASAVQVEEAFTIGFDKLLDEHKQIWKNKWEHSDITIDGDVAAQQGIRFNIFQLNQTYTGRDERLNIGPKGFTGEKYGGVTYWDTEAYCLSFFLSTSAVDVPRNLLIYRHKHLQKAIENAAKLGFTKGAALYPMVTINGEECHNEWEITFEEIHRNGAIAYAIYNYVRYTGDKEYLASYGLEVLIGISRFWGQRVNFSSKRKQYVMLGVTGPNEYENNVNNNWYTSKIAQWTMQYTLEAIDFVKKQHLSEYKRIVEISSFDEKIEIAHWKDVITNFYLPYSEQYDVFLQQDGYLDKEQILTSELDPAQRPINQHWSWDRILRSCFIKQADVLQGIFLFEDEYDEETIRRNFDFYEPRTVHESSLSPCIHAILAARIGRIEKAYEMYLRTSRLDLDDYNKEVHEGLHITSMAGTWMSFVYGFGGLRVLNDKLSFSPIIPEQWKSYSFKVRFRNRLLSVKVSDLFIEFSLLEGDSMSLLINGNEFELRNKLKIEQYKK